MKTWTQKGKNVEKIRSINKEDKKRTPIYT